MFDQLSQLIIEQLTPRRVFSATIVGAIGLGSVFVAPPVVNALRYDTLVTELGNSRDTMLGAQSAVSKAQTAFQEAATDAMSTRTDIASFMSAVDPALLADTDTLDALGQALDQLDDESGIHEETWRPGVKVVRDPAPVPRVPVSTSPVTVDGLSFAIDHNSGVIADFTRTAERITARIAHVQERETRVGKLVEKVLASAAKYGTSTSVLRYDKATVTVKIQLNRVVGNLTDSSLDPIARFRSFQEAVAAVRTSHDEAVAEEERIAREKKEAEERAAEEARIAEELRIAEEARAAEEARQAAEADKQEAMPEPSPTPTTTPTPPIPDTGTSPTAPPAEPEM